MKLTLLATIAVFLCACAPAPATPIASAMSPPDCVMWDHVRAQIPPGVRLIQITDVPGFLKGFNALPPASDFHADEIFVNHVRDEAHVVLITHGCVTQVSAISWVDLMEITGNET